MVQRGDGGEHGAWAWYDYIEDQHYDVPWFLEGEHLTTRREGAVILLFTFGGERKYEGLRVRITVLPANKIQQRVNNSEIEKQAEKEWGSEGMELNERRD